MDPRIADRRRNIREAHRRVGMGRLVWWLGAVGVAAVGLWLLHSPVLEVTTIAVTGGDHSAVYEILGAQRVAPGIPMIDIDADRLEASLLEDPWIAQAVVARDWPTTVVITVSERRPVAWTQTAEGEWQLLASDGVVLSLTAAPDGSRPRLVVLGVPAHGALLGALEFLGSLSEELARGSEAVLGPDGLSAVVGGFNVRVGRPENGADKALALEAVLATDPVPGAVITVVAPTRPAVLPPGVIPTVPDAPQPQEG